MSIESTAARLRPLAAFYAAWMMMGGCGDDVTTLVDAGDSAVSPPGDGAVLDSSTAADADDLDTSTGRDAMPPTATCGDGVTDPGEACDGADTNALTCRTATAGFAGGTLRCAADCQSYDVSHCTAGESVAAASCSRADVQAAIDAASPGDVVHIPAGTCSWSSPVAVDKGLAILGAGIGVTVIEDTASSQGTWQLSADGFVRLSGFTLRGTAGSYNGTVRISRSNTRVDHIRFSLGNDRHPIVASGTLRNVVIDNSTFDSPSRGVNVRGSSSYWTDDSQFAPGTHRGVYIEDNEFSRRGVEVLDLNNGGNYVARHNVLSDGGNFTVHGADSNDRSGGYVEIYENAFINTGSNVAFAVNIRGGISYVHNNTVTGDFTTMFNLQNKRSCYGFHSQPMHSANSNRCEHGSSNPFDLDVSPHDNGWPCKDQIGRAPNDRHLGSYEWGNSADEAPAGYRVQNVGGCSNPSTLDHVMSDRDYFEETVAPGYVPYPYPHPATR